MLKANNSLHSFIEIAGCPIEKLKDRDLLEKFLNEMPAKIGMRVFSPAKTVNLDAEDQIDSGYSGFVMLYESHCSLHSFPNRRHMFIDIFSCCQFDVSLAASHIVDFFQPTDIRVETVTRGELMDKYAHYQEG